MTFKLSQASYEDPYVFGYLSAVAMHIADTANAELFQNKLSIDDRARVARGAVVGIAGISIAKYRATERQISQRKPEFLEGMRQANKMVAVMFGRLGAEDDPEVAKAFEAALTLEPGSVFDGSAAAVAAGILKRAHLHPHIEHQHHQGH
jgi:hypothetical protein